MSEQELIQKKKKKTDYILLRKLEKEYDEAEQDLQSREEILIKSVHREYLSADSKGEFFEELKKSESWYREKFKEYNLPPESGGKSESMKEVHLERKVQSLVDDLEEMEQEVPMIEIADHLKEGTDYKDPVEERKEWIQKTKEELLSESPKQIVDDSKFGKYQETKSALFKITDISKHDFKETETEL